MNRSQATGNSYYLSFPFLEKQKNSRYVKEPHWLYMLVVSLFWLGLQQNLSAESYINPPQVKRSEVDKQAAPSIPLGSTGKLIEKFVLIEPQAMKLCQTDWPWVLGEKEMTKEPRTLKEGDCLALKIKFKQDVRLRLYMQTRDGGLTQILPTDCQVMGIKGTKFKAGEELKAPKDNQGRLGSFSLDDKTGEEWLYAVAFGNDTVEKDFVESVGEIADGCGTPYRNGIRSVDDFLELLTTKKTASNGALDWKVRAFYHE